MKNPIFYDTRFLRYLFLPIPVFTILRRYREKNGGIQGIVKKKQWMRLRVERKIFQKKFVESDESDSYTWGTWDLGELQSTNCTISAMYIS